MRSEKLIFAVLGAIIKVAVVIAVVYIIYQGALTSYDYGYRVLTEPAMSVGEGRLVSISYSEDMSPFDLAEMMETKGLTRDSKLFVMQYFFSEYREDIKPGTYEVSTAMTAEEIMGVMAGNFPEDETE